jgi:putative transposase
MRGDRRASRCCYLKGVSTGDFEEALLALLGKDADGLSASTIGRLTSAGSSIAAKIYALF